MINPNFMSKIMRITRVINALRGKDSDEYKHESMKLVKVCDTVTGVCVLKRVANER